MKPSDFLKPKMGRKAKKVPNKSIIGDGSYTQCPSKKEIPSNIG
jgi:hypothetical protein